MKNQVKYVPLCLALLSIAFASRADTIQYTDIVTDAQSISGTAEELPGVITLSGTITLQQFDPALGTLTAVSWVDTVGPNGTTSWEFLNSGPAPATIQTTQISMRSQTEFPDTSSPGDLSIETGTFEVLGPGSSSTLQLGGLPIAEQSGSPLILASYIGLGTLSATQELHNELSIDSISGVDPSEVSFSGNASMNWTRTITYTYTPVPEPGSLALMGLGGLMMLYRRR